MSSRYAPLPNPRNDPDAEQEMEAAFESDDDDDENRPLNAPPLDLHRAPAPVHRAPPPGTYDFENIDYDYPPPGSPPPPTTTALPYAAHIGNSNGVVPQSTAIDLDTYRTPRRRGITALFGRTAAAVLPTHYVQRFGLDRELVPSGPVGGGMSNDGVFANVTAKPTAPMQVREGDETLLVPEDTQKDAPPSYAAAQLDAVPPYWETTVHLPSQSNTAGEVMIDGLPTGSLFSFLWNMLVSVSFQFVGFLLTYLLHTTHAARLGSRAGLGVTLIQYGFALRGRAEGWGSGGQDSGNMWSWDGNNAAPAAPTFDTAKEAEDWYAANQNNTIPDAVMPDDVILVDGDTATSWLAFALMTVGWFILLTSLLGFWRVKRWENGILSSQGTNAGTGAPASQTRRSFFSPFPRMFEAPGLSSSFLRQGLGLDRRPDGSINEMFVVGGVDEEEELHVHESQPGQTQFVIPDDVDPERARQLASAYAAEQRLHRDLRAAGLL